MTSIDRFEDDADDSIEAFEKSERDWSAADGDQLELAVIHALLRIGVRYPADTMPRTGRT